MSKLSKSKTKLSGSKRVESLEETADEVVQ
jgi:hypothetical protein